MRIIDEKNKKTLRKVLILLTPAEVNEFIDSLQSLLVNDDHVHIDDEQYKRKITIGVYTPNTLGKFSPDINRILSEDD